MKKITDQDPESKSRDIVSENIEQLKVIFPEAFTEDKIDFEALKQLLGGAVNEREEKYGLNWHGKRAARLIALTPSTGTLRPCPEESMDWDKTQNLMIEGDNLEVLKLLQKSYAGKIKVIYIDPPYNTGGDFIYPDDFQDNIKNYLMRTGQMESDGRTNITNTEASGRYHTDWIDMIYPRLKIARNLLRDDGVIFISIDDNEVNNLRKICDDIWGEENFLAQIIWQKIHSTKNDAKYFSDSHEYILCYSKNIDSVQIKLLPRTEKMDSRFDNPDDDPRGSWSSGDLVASGERKDGHYKVTGPTGKVFDVPTGKHWVCSEDNMKTLLSEKRIWFGKNGDAFPRLKRYLSEVQQGRKVDTLWLSSEVGHNQESTREVKSIFDGKLVFDTSKPVRLIKRCLEITLDDKDIVLDFFAGSGTTAHAVMELNKANDEKRRFIMVQLPEPCDENSEAYKFGLRTIADIAKERIRRIGTQICKEKPMFTGDIGFRVFKLDSSNILAWEPDRDNLAATLEQHAEHLKVDRTEQDILYELLLKLGLDLTVPIQQKTITGKTVYSIGAGILLVCLATEIATTQVEPLALGIIDWYKQLAPAGETQVVFRDSAFTDDVAKTNLTAILQQYGLENVRSI
ncbi:site-specific DNA-methyltransferase [Dehalococcoides mccartyi]|uniref:site-specific DNA-methyltransferase n=1 Tax=Dehalococcoides mccartyi TaxID=61435 RepID=UPI0002B77018|nr:site-specific DNA-methyltransferase [Dehalococcoides mccartyi]AGG05705.1 type III restriction-modification protein, methylation subunit [Dehalococcoides mccartyi DCMB5]